MDTPWLRNWTSLGAKRGGRLELPSFTGHKSWGWHKKESSNVKEAPVLSRIND